MPDDLSPSTPSDSFEVFPTPEATQSVDVVKLETRGVTSHRAKLTQGSLFAKELLHFASVLSRLDGTGHNAIADEIRGCHTDRSIRRCTGCHKASAFYNRCEKFWCPLCAPRLSRERREGVEWWTKQIKQPKHLVLTTRNTSTITRETVQRFKDAFSRLRRQRVFRLVEGGFYRLEVTNEDRGWHLHMHVLVDARWVDAKLLSETWGKLVGQDFAIVKVKDARAKDYLNELTKYVVKGDQLASWNGNDIAAFVTAFTGLRSFGVFGTLYGKRTEWREWLDELRSGRVKCECGCSRWEVMSDLQWQWEEVSSGPNLLAMPPPRMAIPIEQMSLL